MEIDSATPYVIRDANLVTLIKKTTDNNNKNYLTKIVAEKVDKNSMVSEEILGERVWKEPGFLWDPTTDYNILHIEMNFPENSLIYINQAYLAIQQNKKIYYCDYFILGQVIEACNLPKDISKYELKGREVKFFHPRYNKDTGEFLGLYETDGFLVVCGDAEEIFLNYGFDKKKSQVLYTNYRRKIPNSFCGTIFNRHRSVIECRETDLTTPSLNFFLPSITDRSETVNQYLNNISISPLDIKQKQEMSGNVMFNPQKLDYHEVESKVMRDAFVKCLKHVAVVSNSKLMGNADGLLCRKDVDVDEEWIGGSNRTTPSKFKLLY